MAPRSTDEHAAHSNPPRSPAPERDLREQPLLAQALRLSRQHYLGDVASNRLMEPVELPRGIWCITGCGVNLEETVDFLWSVTVSNVVSVWADVELIDARADRRGARQPPRHDTPPVVARSHILDEATTLVTRGAGLQFR